MEGMEDPPPKLAWPGVDVEIEEYTSSPPHETKTISMRLRPETALKGE